MFHSIVRGKVSPLIEQWQRICILAERIIKRKEAAAVPPFFSRNYLPAHISSSSFLARSSSSAHNSMPSSPTTPVASFASSSRSLADSVLALASFNSLVDEQGDLSRLTNTLRAVIEVNERCWRGDDCELSTGVRQGLEQVASHAQRYSEFSEVRVGYSSSLSHVLTSMSDSRTFRRHTRGGQGMTSLLLCMPNSRRPSVIYISLFGTFSFDMTAFLSIKSNV